MLSTVVADISIPRVPVPPVHDLCRTMGELVRLQVPGDSAVGGVHTGQRRERS